MKRLLGILLLTAFSTAHADIRRPIAPEDNVKRSTIEGPAAAALYESINSKEIMGSALRTSSSTYKVLRSKDGQDQVVCEKTVSRIRNNSSVSCTTESSQDGTELKEFKPVIRMG